MANADYMKAYKSGKKEYQTRLMAGQRPTLAVLDEILPARVTFSEVSLGLIQVPMDQIVGTKSGGRSNAFAANFMPVLDDRTEFATKWSSLCLAHLEEGIHDPIRAYEYMNRFYVSEGNKRVSVLKYFGAVTVDAYVTRIVPPRYDSPQIRQYYEFMDFYDWSGVNYLELSSSGDYVALQQAVGKEPGELWSNDERLNFSSNYYRFLMAYRKNGGDQLDSITPGDAFLSLLKLYSYGEISQWTVQELEEEVEKGFEEFALKDKGTPVDLILNPPGEKTTAFSRLFPKVKNHLTVAFFYAKTPRASAWTYSHELGRLYLEQKFPEEITTISFENVTKENIAQYMDQAVSQGVDIIFTTAPEFDKASVRLAIQYPDVQVYNCSLNPSHRYVRYYYARMFEAKYIIGAIAGSIAENDRIIYLADHAYTGAVANINAFALGVGLTNPRAKVYLLWPEKMTEDQLMQAAAEIDPACISGKDMLIPDDPSRIIGLFSSMDDSITSLAIPIWNWGKFYEKLLRHYIENHKTDEKDSPDTAISYWWGMTSDVVDILYSQRLTPGTRKLIEILKGLIVDTDFNPFSGTLLSQQGTLVKNGALSPEEIVSMDWLSRNVVGSIEREV